MGKNHDKEIHVAVLKPIITNMRSSWNKKLEYWACTVCMKACIWEDKFWGKNIVLNLSFWVYWSNWGKVFSQLFAFLMNLNGSFLTFMLLIFFSRTEFLRKKIPQNRWFYFYFSLYNGEKKPHWQSLLKVSKGKVKNQ